MLSQKEELKYFAETDCLTAVYNRRKTESIINNEFIRSKRNGSSFSVAIFDLNKFKAINDNKGHDVGDAILKTFAQAVVSRIRTIDTFGRWGGDEFVLVCPDTDQNGAENLLAQLKDSVKMELDKIVTNLGFSCGVSEFLKTDVHYSEVLKRADHNLYLSKKMSWSKPPFRPVVDKVQETCIRSVCQK